MHASRVSYLTSSIFLSCVLLLNISLFSQTPATSETSTPTIPAPAASVPTHEAHLERTAWHVLNSSFSMGKSTEKINVITALGTLSPHPAVVKLLLRALHDQDPDVRLAAVSTLGLLKAHAAIPQLRHVLRDPEPQVSFAAAKALWNMGDHSGRDIFAGVLEGERSASPGMIEEAKKHYLNARTLALMGVEEGAGAVFGPLGYGVTAIRELTKDKGASTRALSAELLGLDHSSAAMRALRDAAVDKNWVVRAAVADALGNSGRRDALPPLRMLLNDEKDAV
ncbi:MAG TPA: HEAT repeat domain-containing protein, partial [Terriglobales bacterium]|nr:HEAT repeat domain-containing protein [Terriglobales bacterium]